MKKFHFLFLSIVFLLSACVNDASISNTVEKKQIKEQLPAWVFAPFVKGYTTVVGVAPPQQDNNKRLQLLAAELDAQAELSKQAVSFIDDSTQITEHLRNGIFHSNIETNTKEISIQNLDLGKAKILKQWVSKDKTLYILYGLPSLK